MPRIIILSVIVLFALLSNVTAQNTIPGKSDARILKDRSHVPPHVQTVRNSGISGLNNGAVSVPDDEEEETGLINPSSADQDPDFLDTGDLERQAIETKRKIRPVEKNLQP